MGREGGIFSILSFFPSSLLNYSFDTTLRLNGIITDLFHDPWENNSSLLIGPGVKGSDGLPQDYRNPYSPRQTTAMMTMASIPRHLTPGYPRGEGE